MEIRIRAVEIGTRGRAEADLWYLADDILLEAGRHLAHAALGRAGYPILEHRHPDADEAHVWQHEDRRDLAPCQCLQGVIADALDVVDDGHVRRRGFEELVEDAVVPRVDMVLQVPERLFPARRLREMIDRVGSRNVGPRQQQLANGIGRKRCFLAGCGRQDMDLVSLAGQPIGEIPGRDFCPAQVFGRKQGRNRNYLHAILTNWNMTPTNFRQKKNPDARLSLCIANGQKLMTCMGIREKHLESQYLFHAIK